MSWRALAFSEEVHAAAWALVHFVWQGSVIAALLWLLLAGVPRAQASLRYGACCFALGLLALTPPATFGFLLVRRPLVAMPGSPVILGAELGVALEAGQGAYVSLWLIAAWGIGSALMTLRLLLGAAALRRLVASTTPAPMHWQWQLSRLAECVRLSQRVRLLISEHVDVPVVLGWLRPVILLPLSALSSLPPAYLEALLAHELGHVRRLDYLVNVVQSCVEALLFYHPAVHWVSRSMRMEREHCCDDIAIQVTGNPLGYARALAEMETLRARLPEPALAANGGTLMLRIERILKRPGSTQAEPRALLTASCVLASALGLALAGTWACGSSSDGAEAPASVEQATADLAAPALSVRWLPANLAQYEAALTEAAQRHGVDPALVAIVTLVESLGDPLAQSPVGARGLMQLMPATAADIAAERQIVAHTPERLFEPAYNLDLGAWYLARQLDTFGSGALGERSVELAAVAYNGGPQLAQAYLAGSAALWPETARYRDLVVGMWNERNDAESPTFAAWRQRLNASTP
jgi:soluble lytic murein transglycosylase-like protein